VLQFNGYTYWAWSDNQNAVAMAIVAYDSNGVAVKQWNRNGARYVWDVRVDPVSESVSFVGQANARIEFTWSDLFIPQASGELRFVDIDAHAMGCLFAPSCAVTANNTTGTIPLPANVTGSGTLVSSTFVGQPQSPHPGTQVYLYRVDMSGAVSQGEAPCVTDLSIDFGPQARLSFDGTGQLYDAFVVASGGQGTVGVYSITKSGNVVDVVFNQPICAGASVGSGLSSNFVGLVSLFPPRAAAAIVGWPGLSGLKVSATLPNHR
jgi:hypothetical protein